MLPEPVPVVHGVRHHAGKEPLQLLRACDASGTQIAPPCPIHLAASREYASAVATNAGKVSVAFTAGNSMPVCT
jgi:hypothetical protein